MSVNLVKRIDIRNHPKGRLPRVTALSGTHRGRGDGVLGGLNLQTVYTLLFSDWKPYFSGISQKLLPNNILVYYTKQSCLDEKCLKPFSTSVMSRCKNGSEGISDNSEAIAILSGYLAGKIVEKLRQQLWNGEALRRDILGILDAETDKTGLDDFIRLLDKKSMSAMTDDKLESLLFDFFAAACLRNNVMPTVRSGDTPDEARMLEEMLRTNLYDFENVALFQSKYIPVFLAQGGYDGEQKRFTYAASSPVTLPKVLTTNGRALLIGRDGAGKTTLLLSFLLYYHQLCERKSPPEWYTSEHFMAQKPPYDTVICINGKDIGEKYYDNPDSYIQYFGKTLHFKGAQQRTLLVVDGLEAVLNISYEDALIKPRGNFLVMLRKYLAANPDVHFLMAATESAFNNKENKDAEDNMTKFFSETDCAVYRIVPPDIKEFNAYCDKNNVAAPMRDKILRTIRNNREIQEIISTHLMLSYFMRITLRHSGVIAIRSELQLLREIAEFNIMTACADLASDRTPIQEYDVKSIIALFALMMTERSFKRIPVYADDGRNQTNDNSMERMLWGERLNSTDRFLSENSYMKEDGLRIPFIPNESRKVSVRDKIEKLVDLLRRSHIPFIRIMNDDSGQQTYFEFSSSVWQNYFASYALANGIGLEKDTSIEARRQYLSERIKALCFGEEEQDENMLSAWSSIIANAPILNREIAKGYIDTIAEYAVNSSPKWRRARECATLILLKIIRNNPFIDTSLRLKCIHYALSYYFYHFQLDDFDAILRFSTHRESICRHLLTTFFTDVKNNTAIPRYLFCVGYICYRWIPIAELERPRTPEELTEIAMRYVDGSEEDCNSEETVAAFCRRFNSGGFTSGRSMKPQFLMGVMALCNYYWQGSAETLLTEIARLSYSSAPMSTSSEINGLLLRLTQYPDWRIRNVACFALTHIGAYELDCTSAAEVTVIPPSERRHWLDYIIESDFDARQMAASSHSSEKSPLCGALRLLTLVRISAEDYGIARSSFTDLLQKESMYRQLWNDYLDDVKRCSDTADDDGNSRRYLALIFKICFLLGIWREEIRRPGSDNPIWILLRLKDRLGKKKIGLKYDREELLFDDIRAIVREWELLP